MTRRRRYCVVPHCPRWRGDRKGDPLKPGWEWICAHHWKLTSAAWRRRWRLFKRRGRPDLSAQMWIRLREQAIERAVGIRS